MSPELHATIRVVAQAGGQGCLVWMPSRESWIHKASTAGTAAGSPSPSPSFPLSSCHLEMPQPLCHEHDQQQRQVMGRSTVHVRAETGPFTCMFFSPDLAGQGSCSRPRMLLRCMLKFGSDALLLCFLALVEKHWVSNSVGESYFCCVCMVGSLTFITLFLRAILQIIFSLLLFLINQ